jgi:regulator of sigma E protease
MPHLVDNQFIIKRDAVYVEHAHTYVVAGTIEQGSPADKAGIKDGDIIVAAGDPRHLTSLANADQLPKITQEYAGKTLAVQYRQDETSPLQEKTVQLRSTAEVDHLKASGKDAGYLGVGVDEGRSGVDIVRSTWSAPVVAAGTMWQFTALTFQALGKAVAGVGGIIAGFVTHNTAARQAAQTEASSQVAGPVGIFFVFKYGSALGIRFILLIVAILSLTLAIMNILPIPALDGGRLWLMLFTRAIHRPLSPEREEAINAAGFAFLMALIILITVVDVRRFL